MTTTEEIESLRLAISHRKAMVERLVKAGNPARARLAKVELAELEERLRKLEGQ